MIFQSAPAWTFKGRRPQSKVQKGPSPDSYKPLYTKNISKSPSWKQYVFDPGLALNQNTSPGSYYLPSSEKINKFGIIGRERARAKENVTPSPGPAYFVRVKQTSPSISISCKHQNLNKTIDFPGPGAYEMEKQKENKGIKLGREERFTCKDDNIRYPGPGNYQSVRPSSAKISFTRAERQCREKLKFQITGRHYESKNFFDQNRQNGKGFSLGLKCKQKTTDLSPGPAEYSPNKLGLASVPSITISGKFKDPITAKGPSATQYSPKYTQTSFKAQTITIGKAERFPLFEENESPGPGSYLKTEFIKNGGDISLGMSRRRDQRNEIPGPSDYSPNKSFVQKRPQSAKLGKSNRFEKFNTETSPSPGQYDPKISYSTSQSLKYAFNKKSKLSFKIENNPGPGSYNIPSSICNISAYALK